MKTKADPNVVPLCDILLVLLIIFMVITPVAQAGMDVRIPETGPGRDDGKPVVLTIEKDGLFKVNNETFESLQALETRLTDIYLYRSTKTIFVKAHAKIPYKEFIRAIDIVKKAGVDTICPIPTKYRDTKEIRLL
jgi:biopolymer transport protein TolR